MPRWQQLACITLWERLYMIHSHQRIVVNNNIVYVLVGLCVCVFFFQAILECHHWFLRYQRVAARCLPKCSCDCSHHHWQRTNSWNRFLLIWSRRLTIENFPAVYIMTRHRLRCPTSIRGAVWISRRLDRHQNLYKNFMEPLLNVVTPARRTERLRLLLHSSAFQDHGSVWRTC